MLRGNYKLGSVITYRYMSPTARDRVPMVFVLTSKHRDGMVHGINLRYLTPLQQQQLQYYFKTPQEREQEKINPFQQQSQLNQQVEQQKQAQQQAYEQKKQEAEQERQGYVVRPAPGNIFGVSTFTKTKEVIVQKARAAYGLLSRYIPFGGQKNPPPMPVQQPPIQREQIPNVQTNPYIDNPSAFYYSYVKPLFGSATRNYYRTYKHQFIQNERVLVRRQ